MDDERDTSAEGLRSEEAPGGGAAGEGQPLGGSAAVGEPSPEGATAVGETRGGDTASGELSSDSPFTGPADDVPLPEATRVGHSASSHARYEAEAAGAGMGLGALLKDTLLHPRRAMIRLAAKPGRRWFAPLLLLVLVTAAAAVSGLPASKEYRDAVQRVAVERAMKAQLESGAATQEDVDRALAFTNNPAVTGIGVFFAILAPIVGVLIVAAIMHMMGTVLGGQQTFTQMFTVTTWARLPIVFGLLVQTVQHLMGGWDPNPRGLSGLVAVDPLAAEAQKSYLGPLLAEIELWNLWYLGLLAIAVWAAARLSGRKAVIAVLVYVALRVALGEVGVVLSNLMSGFGG